MSGKNKVSFDDFRERRKNERQLRFQNKPAKDFSGKIPPFVLRRNYWKAPTIKRSEEVLNDIKSTGRTYSAVKPIRVRLIPGDQNPWYKYYSQWVTVRQGDREFKRVIISNAWNDENLEERKLPCTLWWYACETKNKDLTAKRQDAITVLVLEHFYKVPRVSASGKEYYEYVMSLGEDRYNRSLDPEEYQKYEKVFGQQRYLSLYPTQLREFQEELDAQVGCKCSNCGEGELSVHGYACSSCGFVLADHNMVKIPMDEEETLRTRRVDCPECKEKGVAAKLHECVKSDGKGTWAPGCNKPTPSDPYSGMLTLFSVGNKICIDGFEPGFPEEELKDYLLQPLDFDYFLGQQSLEDQAKSMNRENPWDDAAQRVIDDWVISRKNGSSAVVEYVEEDEFEEYDDDDDDDENDGIDFS